MGCEGLEGFSSLQGFRVWGFRSLGVWEFRGFRSLGV